MELEEGKYYKLIVQTPVRDLTYTCKIIKINKELHSVSFIDKLGNSKNYNLNFIREWTEINHEDF